MKPDQFKDSAAFKNFHRSLCERFGYSHDEQYWWRDLGSLEEHIAASVKREPLSEEALGEVIANHAEENDYFDLRKYARAIEQAHGIGSEGDGNG